MVSSEKTRVGVRSANVKGYIPQPQNMEDRPPHVPKLNIADLAYDLPPHRIAAEPLPERDASKLLVANGSTGEIRHDVFRNLPQLLPAGSALVVNTTRVIRARLEFRKPTGGVVEVLLTSPVEPSVDPAYALLARRSTVWICLIGGRNVVPDMVLTHDADPQKVVQAIIMSRSGNEALVRFEWSNDESFGDVVSALGSLPLPPYLGREAEEADDIRYQTVYAEHSGSVAAPTAGLHFTDQTFADLSTNNVQRFDVTLHVGLGTFKPVNVADARDHTMHRERIGIGCSELARLSEFCKNSSSWITAVGTTSLRTLESLYRFGVKLLSEPHMPPSQLDVSQWACYESSERLPSRSDAFKAVVKWAEDRGETMIWGETGLLIGPGCTVRAADALVTNFHQPGNTLLLLVAGFVGTDLCRRIYQEALDNNYRFLSYGDSSYLIRADVEQHGRVEDRLS